MTYGFHPALDNWLTAPDYRTVPEARIVEMIVLAGWGTEPGLDGVDRTPEAQDTLFRFVELGLPFRAVGQDRLFDPVEMVNFARTAGVQDRHPFWTDRCVPSNRSRVRSLNEAVRRERAAGLRMAVDLRRTFSLRGVDRAKPLRLRLPIPLEDCWTRDIAIETADPETLVWQPAAGRQVLEARGHHPGSDTVTLAVRYKFTAAPRHPAAPVEDLTPYLAATEAIVRVTPAVRETAVRLGLGPQTPARDKVARIWQFMLDDLVFGSVHHDELEGVLAIPDRVLATGQYDCHFGSALLAALCRAAGVPARLVTGFLTYPDLSSYHSWAEIWLEDEGWASYDLLCWDLSAGGRARDWRDVFAGRLEPRLKTQSFPRVFTGHPGVSFPPRWHLLTRRAGDATESSFVDRDTGALIYSDEIKTTLLDNM